ncbi:hypothetical protein MYIN104542_20285 [Mycobacterium intermedium]
MPFGKPELKNFLALVITADHIIQKILDERNPDKRIFLRVNTREGGVEHVHIPLENWVRPDIEDQIQNGKVDAAVCWFPGNNSPTGKYDYLLMPASDEIADRALLAEEDIGIGNEVFFAGLFIGHSETTRNEPIIRSGIIAAMPETIESGGLRQHAFLIESRSVGGLSGSPVFASVGFWRHDEDGQLKLRTTFRTTYLIGVISGHWHAEAEIEGAIESEFVNMGIAKVTPMDKVLPLMDQCVRKFELLGAGLIIKDLVAAGKTLVDTLKFVFEEAAAASQQGAAAAQQAVAAAQQDQSTPPGSSTGQTTSPAEDPSTEIR